MNVQGQILLGGLALAMAVVGFSSARADTVMPGECGLVNWHGGKPARPSEQETICEYFRAVHHEDFQKAYGLFSKSLQKKIPYREFLASINVAPGSSASGVSAADGGPRPQASGREFLGTATRAGLGRVYSFAEDFPNFTDSTTLAFQDGADGKTITGFETTHNW